MDNQQQQMINKAAQEFTDALVASYRATSDRTVAAQELGAQQIEYFFNTVIDNLRVQADGASQVTRQLASQQQLAQKATQEFARVSTDNYMDLLDSVFSFYQGGASRTQRRIEEAEARASEAEARAEEAERSARAARRRAEEAESIAEEAKGRAEQSERRAEEAERNRNEPEGRGEDDMKTDAVRRPLSNWVRTSGRSKARGRNTRSRGRSLGRR
jgi:Alanine-zipper, major outer membrane lipoprotein